MVNSAEEVNYVHNTSEYYNDLKELLNNFIDSLQLYYKKDGAKAASIDSPNVHRMIELVVNTIPTFGHSLMFAELPFEAFHQNLKANISKNTNSNAHNSAMKSVLLTEWLRAIASELYSTGHDHIDKHNYISLARKLVPFGSYVLNGDLAHPAQSEFQNDILDHIEREVIGPVSSFLCKYYTFPTRTITTKPVYKWSASSFSCSPMFSLKVPNRVRRKGRCLIKQFTVDNLMDNGIEKPRPTSIEVVELKRGSLNDGTQAVKTRLKSYQKMAVGDVIRVACRAGTSTSLLVDTIDVRHRRLVDHEDHFFILLGLYQLKHLDTIWSVWLAEPGPS